MVAWQHGYDRKVDKRRIGGDVLFLEKNRNETVCVSESPR